MPLVFVTSELTVHACYSQGRSCLSSNAALTFNTTFQSVMQQLLRLRVQFAGLQIRITQMGLGCRAHLMVGGPCYLTRCHRCRLCKPASSAYQRLLSSALDLPTLPSSTVCHSYSTMALHLCHCRVHSYSTMHRGLRQRWPGDLLQVLHHCILTGSRSLRWLAVCYQLTR